MNSNNIIDLIGNDVSHSKLVLDILSYYNDYLNTNNEKTKFCLAQFIKMTHPNLYDDVIQQTSFLDKFATSKRKISFKERLYVLKHGLTDRPVCKMCKTAYVSGFDKHNECYRKWCGPKCQAADPECIAKSK